MSDEDKDIDERFEKMKQRAATSARERLAIQEKPIALPKFVWDELEFQANELGLTPSQLLRGWIFDRLRE